MTDPSRRRAAGVQGLPLAQAPLRDAAATARDALEAARARRRRPAAEPPGPREQRRADHARRGWLKWVALAIAGWLLALARPVPGQRPDRRPGVVATTRSARCRAAALLGRQQRSWCSAPTPRTGGSIDKSASAGPVAAPTRSCSIHAGFGERRASCRSRATRGPTSRATARSKINAAYALGGAGADDQDRRGLPRQRAQDQPRRRGRLQELPGASSTRSAGSP